MGTLLSKWSGAEGTCCTAISLRVQWVSSNFWGFVLMLVAILPDHVVGETLRKAPLSSVMVGELKVTLLWMSVN